MSPAGLLATAALIFIAGSSASGAATGNRSCVFKPVDPPDAPRLSGIVFSGWSIGCPDSPVTYGVAADIDTKAAISFDATPGGSKTSGYMQETTSEYLAKRGVQLAVNANLFDSCCGYMQPGDTWVGLNGWAFGGGGQISSVGADPSGKGFPFDTSLVIGDGAVSIKTIEKGDPLPVGTQVAVTGSHRVLSGGQVPPLPSDGSEFFGPNARTAAGLSSDGRHLWLIVVNGHYCGSGNSCTTFGLTLPQEAEFLAMLGASDAINLDGGGSSTMVVEDKLNPLGRKVLNSPSDYVSGCTYQVGKTCERYVGLNFGVHASVVPPDR